MDNGQQHPLRSAGHRSAGRLFLVILFLLLTAGLWIPSGWLDRPGLQIGFTQLVLVLLPVLLYGAVHRPDRKTLFPLGRLSLRDGVAVILGCVFLLPVGSFFNGLVYWGMNALWGDVPLPQLPIGPEHGTLAFFLVLAALLPGITEELLARGILLRTFRPLGTRSALWISALLFALLHLHPVNFFGPLFLGLFFGWAVLRTGTLLAAMLGHSVYNGLVIGLNFSGLPAAPAAPDLPVRAVHLLEALPGAVLFSLALWWLLRRWNRTGAPPLEPPLEALRTTGRLFWREPALRAAAALYLALCLLIVIL